MELLTVNGYFFGNLVEEFEKILTSVLIKMTSCVLEVVFAFH